MTRNPQAGVLIRWFPFLGISLWITLAVVSALRYSATTDEIQYLPAGLSLLEYNDFRMVPEHPPLMRILYALPVYLLDRPDMSDRMLRELGLPRDHSPWYQGRAGAYGCYLLFLADPRPVGTRLVLGRLPAIAVGLLGGLFAWKWGREVGKSRRAGWLAGLFLLSYPEYLGHSALMTLDVPMAAACAAISWSAWGWWKRPTLRRGALVCVLAGVGSLIKLPVVVFTVFAILTLAALSFLRARRGRIPRVVALAAAVIGSGILAAWAGAGFRFSYVAPGAEVAVRHAQVPPIPEDARPWLAQPVNFLWRHQVLPETTLCTIANFQKFEHREYYFLGETAPHGWYSYFAVTFLLKSTPALLAGTVIVLVLAARRVPAASRSLTRRWRWERAAILWTPFVLLLAATVAARVNQGHRYILFFYLPIAVALGAATDRWLRAGTTRRGAAGVLLAAQILSLALAYPNFTTYVNVLTGSPYKASRYLGDSNTDWGQDLFRLAGFLRSENVGAVNLALYGLNLPDAYDITQYRWIEKAGVPPPFVPVEHRDRPLDPNLPTVVSVNALPSVRRAYPDLFARDPDILLNSIVIFLPGRAGFGTGSDAGR